MADVGSFPGYETNSQYRPYGNNYGNPLINSLLYGAFGLNYAPRPGEQQSYYDASIERDNTRQLMGLQGEEFANNMAFKAGGLNTESPFLQMLGRHFGSPDSAISRLLSPLVGGNPMQASMKAFSGFQGANIMGAFGRTQGVTGAEIKDLMKVLEKNFYKQDSMDKVSSDMNAEYTHKLLSDPELAKEVGVGKLNEKDAAKAKELGAYRRKETDTLNQTATSLFENEDKRNLTGFKENVSKEISDHIEKALIKANKLTSQELKDARDSNGIIKRDVVRNLINKEYERADVEEAGLDYEAIKSTKITDEKTIKRIQNSRHQKDISSERISQYRLDYDKEGTTDEEKKEITRKIKDELISRGVKEKDIKMEGGIFGGGDKIDTEYLDKQQEALKLKNYNEYMADQYTAYKKAGGKYSGINFELTRGFNLEDLTGAYQKTAELNMTGKKGTFTGKFDDFLKSSGGALDAARSVFGNKSGAELAGKISDLMGTSAVDLTSKTGGHDIEKYLRDMKATARVAGVSINAMLDTIDAAKQLANSNPRLKYLSASSVSDMTVKAFETTASAAANMSSSEKRALGGAQGITTATISEKQRISSSDTAQKLMAIQSAFAGDPDALEAVQNTMKEFPQGVRPGQWQEFYDSLASKDVMKKRNMTSGDLVGIGNGKIFRETGSENREFYNKATELTTQATKSEFYNRLFNNPENDIDRSGFEKAYEKASQQAAADKKVLRKEDFKAVYTRNQVARRINEYMDKHPGTTVTPEQVIHTIAAKDPQSLNMLTHDAAKVTILSDLAIARNPELAGSVAKMREASSKLDERLAKEFASSNAPVVTQAVNTLASGGKFDQAQASALMNIFAKGDNSNKLRAGFQQAVTAASREDTTRNYTQTVRGINEALGTNFKQEDVREMAVYAGASEFKTADEAKEKLKSLQDAKANNTLSTDPAERAEQLNQLSALENMDKAHILDSNKALQTFQENAGKGRDASAFTAAAIEGIKDTENKKKFDQGIGKEMLGEMSTFLSDAAQKAKDPEVSKDIAALQDYYGGDMQKLEEDMQKGEGLFNKDSDAAKKYGTTNDKGEFQALDLGSSKFEGVKSALDEQTKAYEEAKKTVTGGDEKNKDKDKDKDPAADTTKQLKALTDVLQKGKLVDSLVHLATKV